MNAHLKDSLQSAERTLPEAGQEALANVIEAFTLNYGLTAEANFTGDELAEIRQLATEPFVEADPKEVADFFAQNAS
ncbi:hypothetical protein OCA8868_03330 [Octadecabacter ascidiaceicola]|uniref:Uncharacterized protein n=2 Tax=Octadecabacter ascidiaceicola TaxID=1655543 RepID=A0A238KRX8_9RHOB|nr:hypothetical protein OCA8868_03330 [Octadecabacter ascidiaceicola]